MSLALSSSNMSVVGGSSFSGSGLFGSARGVGSRLGLGLGAGGAASGLGLGLGAGAGAGAMMGLGGGAGAMMGLGGGAGAMMGLGGGAGAMMGLGGGAGAMMGLGGGAGAMMGLGGGMGAGGAAGALVPSAAFSMGRTVATGGLNAASALVAKPEAAPLIRFLSRADEKSVLSGLNDRFSAYMAKVKLLQQENVSLEAKLSQLTGGTDMAPETTSVNTAEYETQIAEFHNTLKTLTLDTVKLEIELDNTRGAANELKAKYDFEQGVKAQLEADIVAMKKDLETAADLRIDLDAKHTTLQNELDFVTKTQIEELSNLHSKLGPTSTDKSVSMIEVDTDKSFDIASALTKLRTEYEKTVQQHKEEADAYYKLKMDEIQIATEKTTEAMSSTKEEIVVCKKELQSLSLELQSLISANITLEQNLADAQSLTSTTITDCQAQITHLESAIEIAKADLQKQCVSYCDLLDIKLALDIEISTYRKLLDMDDLSTRESSPFVFSSPPDTYSQFKSPLVDTGSSLDPALASDDFTPDESEKTQEDSTARDDKEAAAEAQDSVTGEQTESSTHSENDDSES